MSSYGGLFVFLFTLAIPLLWGQEKGLGLVDLGRLQLLPKQVYVGDRASLTVPVRPGALPDRRFDITEENSTRLTKGKNLTIHRVRLQTRGEETFFEVDFTPYSFGFLLFPPLTAGPLVVDNLGVTVSSLLADREGPTLLVPPMDPLSVPGTSLLLYGTLGFLTLIGFGILAWRLRGSQWMAAWKQGGHKRRLQRSLRSHWHDLQGRLQRYVQGNRISHTLEVSSTLAPEFRELSGELHHLSLNLRSLLQFWTPLNCLALTSDELRSLPDTENLPPGFQAPLAALCELTDLCRFGAKPVDPRETLSVLTALSPLAQTLWGEHS